MTSYQHLDATKVAATIERLRARIEARLDARGLARVAAELHGLVAEVADGSRAAHHRVRRTTWLARVAAALVVLAALFGLALALRDARDSGPNSSVQWLPLVESAVNNIVFAAIVVLFLWGFPERLARRTLLRLLHLLRSLAHVIDMHQLAKDPEQLTDAYRPTPQSVGNDLDAEQFHHYLEYCSEMLSLVGKTAALCAEHTSDPVILDTVSTIETLTTELSQKIWQKITLLHE